MCRVKTLILIAFWVVLNRALPLNTYMAIHSFEVVFDPQDPSFTVGKREDKTGTYVTWTRDDMKTLKRGDRWETLTCENHIALSIV